jgi:hypothetical protein
MRSTKTRLILCKNETRSRTLFLREVDCTEAQIFCKKQRHKDSSCSLNPFDRQSLLNKGFKPTFKIREESQLSKSEIVKIASFRKPETVLALKK